MKKVILFLLTIILLGGIGYTCYVIFSSKNISKIEVEGNVQTLYFVDEVDTPSFQDAKLKITYKSGDVKYLDLKSSNVAVSDFSTSIEARRTMKITYKKQLVTIDYNVIKSGLYYISGVDEKTLTSESKETYKISTTTKFLYFANDGVLKYYSYNVLLNKWFLFDGDYKKDYKYEIVDDKINVYLGNETPDYNFKAEVINGDMIVSSTNYTFENDLQTSKTITKVTNYEMKTNVNISNAEIFSYNFKTDEGTGDKFLTFKVGDTLVDTQNQIYIKVNYSSPLIYILGEDGKTISSLINEVYVVLDDNMIKSNTLQTNQKRSYITHAEIAYESFVLGFYYKVED